MKLNGFEELLHENGIDPEDAFDDRGRCVVTRQGSRAGEYPSFEYSLGEMHMTREQIIKALSGSIDSMITNKRTMIHISGPMAEDILELLKKQPETEGEKYMATTKICDKCKAIGAESQFISFREHIHHDVHDGTYKNRDKRKFDLCDKCAGQIEKLITGSDPDMEILD